MPLQVFFRIYGLVLLCALFGGLTSCGRTGLTSGASASKVSNDEPKKAPPTASQGAEAVDQDADLEEDRVAERPIGINGAYLACQWQAPAGGEAQGAPQAFCQVRDNKGSTIADQQGYTAHWQVRHVPSQAIVMESDKEVDIASATIALLFEAPLAEHTLQVEFRRGRDVMGQIEASLDQLLQPGLPIDGEGDLSLGITAPLIEAQCIPEYGDQVMRTWTLTNPNPAPLSVSLTIDGAPLTLEPRRIVPAQGSILIDVPRNIIERPLLEVSWQSTASLEAASTSKENFSIEECQKAKP